MKPNKQDKIYIAGHNGMVGSAIWRYLKSQGYSNLIGRASDELDLRRQLEVEVFLKEHKPKVIINAAARVGGILANSQYPYEFLMDNMLIQNNLISAAHSLNIHNFIFLGSSCIYPKYAEQPINEEELLNGKLEKTNEWYSIAKISGVKLIEALRREHGRNYVALMPTNLYGPRDNFDLKTSHVLPAMIRKFHDAKVNGNETVILWGSGTPFREFLHVDDLSKAVLFALENDLPDFLYNVGYGADITIMKLAQLVQNIVGHQGDIFWDKSKPDGTPRKLLNSNKIKSFGWKPDIQLSEGISHTYEWFTNEFINNIK